MSEIWSLPQTSDWMTEQMAHEPTRSYAEEIYRLVQDHPYKKALEIGCMWGVSTLAILLAGKGTLLSVDSSDGTHAGDEVWRNGLGPRWSFRLSRSDRFFGQNKDDFDLIYVDGSHEYKDVKNDLFQAWNILRPKGLLFLDDFVHPANLTGEYGVAMAAWELIKENHITEVGTTTRLLYLRKP